MDNESRCCICGEVATKIHWSIIGQIPYHVCNKHYKETTSELRFSEHFFNHMEMGLVNKKTGKFLKMKL
jgi:hypothetical protein